MALLLVTISKRVLDPDLVIGYSTLREEGGAVQYLLVLIERPLLWAHLTTWIYQFLFQGY